MYGYLDDKERTDELKKTMNQSKEFFLEMHKKLASIFKCSTYSQEKEKEFIEFVNNDVRVFANSINDYNSLTDNFVADFFKNQEDDRLISKSSAYKNSNAKNLQDVLRKSYRLLHSNKAKDDFLSNIMYQHEFMSICNIAIALPILDIVHGGYLLEIYLENNFDSGAYNIEYCSQDVKNLYDDKKQIDELMNSKKQMTYELSDEEKDIIKDFHKRERSIKDRQSKHETVKKFAKNNFIFINKNSSEYLFFINLLEYIEYELSNIDCKNENDIEVKDVQKGNNIFKLLENPPLSLFLDCNISDNYCFPVEIQHHQKKILFLLTELKRKSPIEDLMFYRYTGLIYGIYYKRFINSYLSKKIDTIDSTSLLQYENDEMMKDYYIKYASCLSDIKNSINRCKKEFFPPSPTSNLFHNMLFFLRKLSITLELKRTEYVEDLAKINITQLNDEQRKIFIELYNFDDPLHSIEKIKSIIMTYRDAVKTFLGIDKIEDLKKLIKKSSEMWMDIFYPSQSWQKKYSPTDCDLGIFLSIMQVLLRLDNYSIEIGYYAKSRGKEKKFLKSILNQYKDNNFTEIRVFLSLIFQYQYSANIGWVTAYPQLLFCRLLLDKIIIDTVSKTSNYMQMKEALDILEDGLIEIKEISEKRDQLLISTEEYIDKIFPDFKSIRPNEQKLLIDEAAKYISKKFPDYKSMKPNDWDQLLIEAAKYMDINFPDFKLIKFNGSVQIVRVVRT